MKCIGNHNARETLCQVCSLYNRCQKKTNALKEHEQYIEDLYLVVKSKLFAAAANGVYYTSTQLSTWMLGQLKKQSSEVIVTQILTMIVKDSSFDIKERRVIPIKAK
jgi:hypothetical protein